MFTKTLPSFALAALLAALLAGCAATQLDANVHTVGTWPQGRAPGSFAFERLPSQQARAEEQARLEAAAQPALEQAGFKLAAGAPADVLVQVAERSLQGWAPGPEPFFGPGWGGASVYGGRWRAGPWGPGWGGGWGYGFGGSVPFSLTEVSVLILDAQSQKPLYESRALNDGAQPDQITREALFAAALKDFPFNAVSPRRVTVGLPK